VVYLFLLALVFSACEKWSKRAMQAEARVKIGIKIPSLVRLQDIC
jgi:hypothetical protein